MSFYVSFFPFTPQPILSLIYIPFHLSISRQEWSTFYPRTHHATLIHSPCHSLLHHSPHTTIPFSCISLPPLNHSKAHTPCPICQLDLSYTFSFLTLSNLITPEASLKQFISAVLLLPALPQSTSLPLSVKVILHRFLHPYSLPDSYFYLLLHFIVTNCSPSLDCSFSDISIVLFLLNADLSYLNSFSSFNSLLLIFTLQFHS